MNQIQTWQEIFKNNFRSWETLADFLQLDSFQREFILKKSPFTLNLPRRLADKITKGTLEDPILKQFLPTQLETIKKAGFVSDPVEDSQFRCGSKLLHKYEGRVLLVCTSACAMHCRYCFRQNFLYEVEDKTFKEELKIIASDPSIHEVILSGGDPLSLSNRSIAALLNKLTDIPHITRVRFHTRFPIGIPERIDEEFVEILKNHPHQIWFVIHTNHPMELDDVVLNRLSQLQMIGIPVLNQAVLLKGVNDSVEILHDLFEKLVNKGILPYYLHQLDKVEGASHFEVDENWGRELIYKLNSQLPGYAVPKFVKEIAGHPNKTPL